MSESQSFPTAPTAHWLKRLSSVLLIFSGALFVLLLVVSTVLLPRMASVRVGDALLSPEDASEREQKLRAELLAMERTRKQLVLPIAFPAYEELKEEKRQAPSLALLRADLRRAAERTGEAAGVVIESLTLDAAQGTAEAAGRVENVGPRSMTVLAAFIEEVEKLPVVRDLERPSFKREEDRERGFFSPFMFRFRVADAALPFDLP